MKKQNQNRTVYGVIGLGRFGSAVARELALGGAEVLAADRVEEHVKQLRTLIDNAYVTDVLTAENLERMGFGECETVIVCIGSALDVSLLCVLNIQSLGVKHIIAKAASAQHGQLLEKLGAEVIYPERDSGVTVARSLLSHGLLDSINLSSDASISELDVPASLAGKTIKDSNLRAEFGLNIIAIQRGDKMLINLRPDDVLQPDDRLLLIGSNESLGRFMQEKVEAGK